MSETPKVVTVCGSSRFIDVVAVVAWVLERDEGVITMSMHLLPSWYCQIEHHFAEACGVADAMDTLHLRKIDLSDEIFVVDLGGYIGPSTSREIAYAEAAGKTVRRLSAESERFPDLRAVTHSQES